MHKRVKDLSGQKFGRLTILSYSHTQRVGTKGMTRAFFNAICGCGKECIVSGNRVQTGITTSCGCWKKEIHLRPGGAARELYGKYVKRSKSRGQKIELDFDAFVKFVKQNCVYCGAEPSQKIESSSGLESFEYNGIDRWDNNLGYVKNNMVPCCGICNKQKLEQSGEEFINRCKEIASHADDIMRARNSFKENQTCAY